MKVLITSPQRCGSTWLTRITASVFTEPFFDHFIYQNKKPKLRFNIKTPTAISNYIDLINDYDRVVLKTHDVSPLNCGNILEKIPELKIATINRDFKDIVVSRYFHNRYHKKAQKDKYTTIEDIDSAVHNERDDVKAINKLCYSELFENWLHEWNIFNLPFKHERVFTTRYEKLFQTEEIRRYMAFLGAPEYIAPIIQKNTDYDLFYLNESFANPQKEARFFRKGLVGDHKNYMSNKTIEYVNSRCESTR